MCALSSPVWPEKRNTFSSLCQKAAMGEVPFPTGLYSVNTPLTNRIMEKLKTQWF